MGFFDDFMFDSNTQLSPKYTVGDLSKSSTATRLGLDNTPPSEMKDDLTDLALVIEEIEDKYGPVNILSGYRSPEVNSAVGGSSTSKHKNGTALDFHPTLQTVEMFWLSLISDISLADKLGEISLKKDQNAIHITLPYMRGLEYVQNSPRVKSGGSYFRITTDIGKGILKSMGIDPDSKTMLAAISGEENKQIMQAGIKGVGFLAVGLGVFALVRFIKR